MLFYLFTIKSYFNVKQYMQISKVVISAVISVLSRKWSCINDNTEYVVRYMYILGIHLY
jgi:hypothetical protein